jgi:4-methylaminobutanoate oxidase (formaldehyde-forming)
VYSPRLNEGGRLEADLTVSKIPDQANGGFKYFVVATDTAHRHVETHMRRNFAEFAKVRNTV